MIPRKIQAGTSLLEALGYRADDRLLILHADDLGMCHAANTAAIKAFKAGAISSASVMVPCPWFPEIAAWARENPETDLGLHLALTSEWRYYRWRPVAPVDKVKSLVDEQGFLWSSVEQVKRHASPREVETEIRAQIERSLQFGMKPTHIDSHMGTLFSDPRFFEVYVRLGAEYRILPMLMEATPEILAMAKEMGIDYTPLHKRLKDQGFPMLTHLNADYFTTEPYDKRKQRLHDFIRNLKPGVTELIVHLGDDDPEGHAITDSWRMRVDELKVITDPALKDLIRQQNIQLVGYKHLSKAWRK